MQVYKIRTVPFSKKFIMKKDEGTYRKGEIKGIIRINPKVCVGCQTCHYVCPAGAVEGKIGEPQHINYERCINCGQCLIHCPYLAIEQISFKEEVLKKLKDPEYKVVAIIAPAIRVALAEEFGKPPGTLTVGRLWSALKAAGFEIFDNNFTADTTIMEEGTELVGRIAAHHGLSEIDLFLWDGKITLDLGEFKDKPLPQFTSCCPGWVRFVELFYPELLPHVSSCKSPQQMAGAIAKTFGAKEVWKIPSEKIYTVGIMPCTAKIYEAFRPEFNSAGEMLGSPWMRDVDAVLTTRELAEILKELGINPLEFPEKREPHYFEWYSGGATIFGTSGGVMEAAIRFAFSLLSGLHPAAVKSVWDFPEVRGKTYPLVQAEIKIPLRKEYAKLFKTEEFHLRACVVNGIGPRAGHIRDVLEDVKKGKSEFHFIEVMTCPGGCQNGGGQPRTLL